MIPSIDVIVDASGAFGYGAFYIYILHRCFQLQWPADWQFISITVKELILTVIVAALFKTSMDLQMYLLQICQHGSGRAPQFLHLARGPSCALVVLLNILLGFLPIAVQGGTCTRHQ